ncbi:uncharacterized protein FIBRA_09522 [Fibroporia radiculosa]|uniref:Peptidase A1 domain-containing protein n=1 Tax=Fibroporia radiculosa TaxID=599839 RepID=J7SCI0_9APHY|nr:uncharacterized protein FIBRA_09522 [Fibroporia radiculosa]CCM07181.1 predicted protein [Fibroporia radiculosa]
MASALTLLTTLALSCAAAASPIVVRDSLVSLPLLRQLNTSQLAGLVTSDQARARSLQGAPQSYAAADNVSVVNQATTYTATVGFGSPAQSYTLIIDTGSSNTWIGARQPVAPVAGATDTGHSVSVSYGSGSFSGEEYDGTVTLGDMSFQQSFGIASSAQGFEGVDGILGIGPTDLTAGTVSDTPSVATVTDNLYQQGKIPQHLVAVSFEPTVSQSDPNGAITFGGTDPSRYNGTINYTPRTTTSPASAYWGINQTITYGSPQGPTILAATAGIVDTGTTLILIASNAFDCYQAAVGGTMDENTGLLRISSSQYKKLQSLYFNVGSVSYELTANAQIWPRSLNTAIGGEEGEIYLVVNDLGTPSGQGLDFINGYTFLERYYSVFDTTNNRIGFAETAYTHAITN